MKKILAIVLAVLMLAVVFFGCGKDPGTSSGGNTENSVVDSKWPSGYPFKEGAFKGQTLYLYNIVQPEDKYTQEFKEATGAEVVATVTDYAERIQVTTTAIVSGNKCDMVGLENTLFPSYVIKGLIMPVTDVLDIHNENDVNVQYLNQSLVDFYTYDGKEYAFNFSRFGGCGYLIYRKSYFEQAGLDDPYELWKEGKWTFDALENAAAALTYDSDDDGVLDKFGIGGYIDSYWIGCAGGDANTVRWAEDGTPHYALDDPDILECLEFYRNLQDKGYFKCINDPGDDFAQGKTAILGGMITWYTEKAFETIPAEDIGFVQFPIAPSNTSGVVNNFGFSGGAYAFPISLSDSNRELVEEFAKYRLCCFERADEDYETAVQERIDKIYGGNREWYEFEQELSKNIWIDNAPCFGILSTLINNNVYWGAANGAIRDLIVQLEPAAQSEIDEVFYGE